MPIDANVLAFWLCASLCTFYQLCVIGEFRSQNGLNGPSQNLTFNFRLSFTTLPPPFFKDQNLLNMFAMSQKLVSPPTICLSITSLACCLLSSLPIHFRRIGVHVDKILGGISANTLFYGRLPYAQHFFYFFPSFN